MRILVTGAKGMLGTDLLARLKPAHEVFGIDIDDADITDESSIMAVVAEIKPDWAIHGAAFTNVDGCEKEPEKAFKVNAEGARNIARACWVAGAKMAYISTDYVYDGKKGTPYVEDDQPAPLNAYGKSKLEGERETLKVLPDALVVRTSWLYGKNGPNFVEAILGQVGKKDELTVVADQVGSPTYTVDLADGLAELVESGASGLVHLSNEGGSSWYEYAKRILELAGVTGMSVRPITTEELGRPALRPAYSVLSKDKFHGLTGRRLRQWDDALAEYIRAR